MTQQGSPSIAIVGGGPGGLVLARMLLVHGIRPTVLEREAGFTCRSQGGSLDIHADSGQIALAKAGLTEQFRRIARYEDQEGRLYDKHGVLRFKDDATEGKDRPEIDRGELRQMLLDSLLEGVVRWGSDVRGVEAQPDGSCDVVFGSGARETFDLVVGADGTWSKVRPAVSDAQPVYSGILFVEMGINDVDRRYPDTADLVGRGLTFALGDSMGLLMHRDAHAHVGFYAAFRAPADTLAGISEEALRTAMLEKFRGWSDDLLALLTRADDIVAVRGIYALPTGHRWKHVPGITLLGDAAHVMSPFGGDGANFAMQDAAELAAALLQSDWRSALPAYEEGIAARCEGPAAMANSAIQKVFAHDGLEHSVRMFESHAGPAE